MTLSQGCSQQPQKLLLSPPPLQWGLGVKPRPSSGIMISSSSLVLIGRRFITVDALWFGSELSKDLPQNADLWMRKPAATSILENVVLAA